MARLGASEKNIVVEAYYYPMFKRLAIVSYVRKPSLSVRAEEKRQSVDVSVYVYDGIDVVQVKERIDGTYEVFAKGETKIVNKFELKLDLGPSQS